MGAAARLRVYSGPVLVAPGLHAVALAVLVWKLGAEPRLAPAPVMNLELTPWRTPPRERPTRTPHSPPPAAARPRAPRLRATPEVPAPAPFPPTAPAQSGAAAAVHPILCGLLGCQNAALAGLTPEERQRCAEQLARGRSEAAKRLDLDARGASDPEPYLARKPKSGCKARAAGDAGPMGEQGAAAGTACAWAF